MIEVAQIALRRRDAARRNIEDSIRTTPADEVDHCDADLDDARPAAESDDEGGPETWAGLFA